MRPLTERPSEERRAGGTLGPRDKPWEGDEEERPHSLSDHLSIEGYASLFWTRDLNDDVTAAGAFAESLAAGAPVKMLHQHDEAEPIGVWDEVFEDAKGLFVRGRILRTTPRGRLVAALVEAGALDGLSIGFRQVKARTQGRLRVLSRVELWEVSIVTFPMLPGARLTLSSGSA